MKLKLLTPLFLLVFGLSFVAQSQNVIDPNDPVITYDANNPPSQPPYGQVGKWVRTVRNNWNSTDYKCYIYKGMPFRLIFPKNYDTTGTTKYPLIVFWHGRGESGVIYDNEHSMRHGGQKHRDAVNNGDFNGFVIYPQNQSGFWSATHYTFIDELIHDELQEIGVDINRVGCHGLSAGGAASWVSIINYPKDYACSVPMSASSTTFINDLYKIREIPMWQSQGGQDRAPAPYTSQQVVNAALSLGMNFKYTVYENLGHGVWNTHYNEPDFFPFFMRHNKVNPVVYYRKTEFCPGDPITATMALTDGFTGYQWRKDGVIIPGATSHVYTANQLGTYDARIIRGNDTSYWSPTPIVLKMKAATVTPPIEVADENSSNVIPSPDMASGVNLKVTGDFEDYSWRKVGSSTVLGTDQTFTATTPGQYVVSVTEEFGCSSSDSPPYLVINGNGSNAPSTPINAHATPLTKTSLRLSWGELPNQPYPETGFELYRTTTSGSNYEFLTLLDPNKFVYTDEDLIASTSYYYILRAINNNGASAATPEFSATTLADTIPPSVPANLTVTRTSSSSISLRWNSSTDDAGVDKYEIYRGNYKVLVTSDTFATVQGLTQNTVYSYVVKARDYAMNRSAASNQVTAAAVFSGLYYEYYHGSWSSLPDFDAEIPVEEGVTPNIDIEERQVDDDFGFRWSGYIDIPVAGSYTFETRSDDGSKLYIGGYGPQYEVVDNDGLHGNQYREGTYNFPTAGPYPIVMTFFERGGGQNMQVFWKNTAHGVGSREEIPDQYFGSSFTMPCCPPSAPYNLSATAASPFKINLNWLDSATNETGFQIFRSSSIGSGYTPIGIVGPNVTTYSDQFNLNPATTYYYQIVALGQYGQSHEVVGAESQIGDINSGIAATDNRSGNGFIMYSEESVHDRFNPNPHGDNSDHLIAIVYDNGDWKFDNNNNIYSFTPEPTDLILAAVDFSSNEIFSYEGLDSTIHGIAAGFSSGDLTFFAQRWNGGNNNGEFTINGTYFNRNVKNAAQATTLPLVGAPVAPDSLTAVGTGNRSISLTWKDNSNNELAFIIKRSQTSGAGFFPLDTIPANNTGIATYVDSILLDPHSDYFFQVVASNNVAQFASNEAAASTQNSVPVIVGIDSIVYMRYGTSLNIPFSWSDDDNDGITINVSNLPSFGSFINNNGSGSLSFNPAITDTNTYQIDISVADLFGGAVNKSLILVVSDNNLPTLSPIANVTIAEGETQQIPLSATDLDGLTTLSWTANNLPGFASIDVDSLGNAQLVLEPGYADGGSYSNITIKVQDNENASDFKTFGITVTEENPTKRLLVNYKYVNTASSPWVNVTSNATYALNYEDSSPSGISTKILAPGYTKYNSGANTGSNAGIVPDNVLKDYYWFGGSGAPVTVDLSITGLDTNKNYTVKLIGSSVWNGTANNGHTVYSSNGQTDSVNTQNNSTESADLIALKPDQTGKLLINMKKGADATFGFVNGMIIEEIIGLNDVPAAPRDLAANFINKKIELNWHDAPYNELGYNIERFDPLSGLFTKINNQLLPANTTTYVDDELLNNTAYTYRVVAVNNAGSGISNTASATTSNLEVYLTGVDTINLNEGGSASVMITAGGVLPNDTLSWTGINLPSFVTLVPVGSKSVQLNLNPLYADGGPYDDFSVQVVTSNNDTATHSLFLSIGEVVPNNKLYANFKYVNTAGSPWTNVTSAAPKVLNYENGTPSNISLDFTSPSYTAYNEGTSTGNNSGVAPDNVLLDYYWFGGFGAPLTVDIDFLGMDTSKHYNLSLISSSSWSGTSQNGHTVFEVNGVKDSVNTQRNTSKTVDFEGVVPNSNGKITVNMSKGKDALFGFVNGVVIDEIYDYGKVPAAPRALKARYVNGRVGLSWYDAPFNETGFNVFRSDSKNGFYYQINFIPLDANTTEFTDNSANYNSTYYYKVKAVNDNGESAYSNAATPKFENFAPELTIGSGSTVKIDSTLTISLSALDDNYDPVSFSSDNLPGFVTIVDNGNGSGSIVVTPNSDDVGFYSFDVKATDTNNASTSKNVSIEVTDNILHTVRINFNQYPNAAGPAPWNNMNQVPVNGGSLLNLVDENNTNTNIGLYLQSAWGGIFNQGAQTGDNSGIVPDAVLKEYYWFGAFGAPNQVSIRIGNLDNTKKYRFRMIGSSVFHGSGISDNGITVYTIGNTSVPLNVEGNTSNEAVITDVIADNNGNVNLTITKGVNVTIGYINALIIEVLPGNPGAFDPNDLKATAISTSAIDLDWMDNSFDETGFIVERCTTGLEVDFTPIDTLPANSTSYTDTNVLSETVYYYRVRGTKVAGYTGYTNTAWSGTISYTVKININGDALYNAPAPWNNLGVTPFDDYVFTGFTNDKSITLGMEMIWDRAMQGANDWGLSTGNNSGIVPDTVMRSFFFNDAFDPSGIITMTNMSQEYAYNFKFFGSIATSFDINTMFMINSDTVINNQDYNTSEMVAITGVVSDVNNEIEIRVQEAPGSRWAIFNAMIIEAIPAPAPTSLKRKPISNNPTPGAIAIQYGEADPEIQVYPNPIHDNFVNIKFENASYGDVAVTITDLSGRTVASEVYEDNKVQNGAIRMDMNDSPLNNGMYILRVQFGDSKVRTSRLVKY